MSIDAGKLHSGVSRHMLLVNLECRISKHHQCLFQIVSSLHKKSGCASQIIRDISLLNTLD